MKRAFGIALLLLLIAVTGTAWAKSYDHPLVDITFHLQPDGSADVTEIRSFRFDGSFSEAFFRKGVRGQYGTYDIQYQGVWDADTNQPLRWEQSTESGERVLNWYYSAQDTTKRFLIRYRILNAVQRYSDAAQFYWQAVERTHALIREVRLTVVPPRPSPTLFKVFIHSEAAPGELDIAGDFSRATITQSDIPDGSFVELRVLLDPALFPRVGTSTAETHESLLEDEKKQAERTLREGEGISRLFVYGVGGAGLMMALLAVGLVWTYLRYGKEPNVNYDAPYERDAPSPLPPAVVPAILSQGSVQTSAMSRGFAATLLEAARLGYLTIEEREDKGLLGTGLFRGTDLVYRLTDKGKALFTDARPPQRPGERALEPFEIDVLTAVFHRAGDGTTATSDQIERWGKTITSRKSNYLIFVESWGPKLRTWFESHYFKLDDKSSERAKGIFIGITVAAIFIGAFVGFGLSAAFVIPLGIIFIAVAAKALSRRTAEGALEVKRWDAFARFMSDFSSFKDAGPMVLPLWERYLVYATALGVADRLLANLKLVATELNTVMPSPVWYHGAAFREGITTAGLVSSMESLTRSFSNFQSLSRSLSSSSSSGGGFSSGGGGGGGGGGSSGAR
ncbi:MAG TPA: DUF2207 domain-containing protein [bacterium]|nr:DUF2207 domain-containing protein [bacterium]